ncbi:MAG: hypothetical protein ACLFQ8_00670 [Candidatus Aenigmatarchaeota archaeon]
MVEPRNTPNYEPRQNAPIVEGRECNIPEYADTIKEIDQEDQKELGVYVVTGQEDSYEEEGIFGALKNAASSIHLL